MKSILSLAVAISVAACSWVPNISPHRMEIQQGNFVSQEMVAQLKPGMSKDQVKFILGTPLIADVFHADRWDYVFTRLRSNSRELEQRRIAVYFEDGKLKRVDGDVVASGDAPGAAGGSLGKP